MIGLGRHSRRRGRGRRDGGRRSRLRLRHLVHDLGVQPAQLLLEIADMALELLDLDLKLLRLRHEIKSKTNKNYNQECHRPS